MGQLVRMPPRGHYLAWEVGQLAGVSGQMVGQWARRGYIRSSVSPVAPRVYSFQDVAEAMVVHELLDRGVPHSEIRTAIKMLGDEYGDWPLTEAPMATVTAEGRSAVLIGVGGEDGARYDVARKAWQQVIEPADLDEIRAQLRRGGWAVRRVPDLQHIEIDPDRLSGRPTIRGRRIAAEDVALIADGPGGVELLRDDYDLDETQIADARRWWREVRRLEAQAA